MIHLSRSIIIFTVVKRQQKVAQLLRLGLSRSSEGKTIVLVLVFWTKCRTSIKNLKFGISYWLSQQLPEKVFLNLPCSRIAGERFGGWEYFFRPLCGTCAADQQPALSVSWKCFIAHSWRIAPFWKEQMAGWRWQNELGFGMEVSDISVHSLTMAAPKRSEIRQNPLV